MSRTLAMQKLGHTVCMGSQKVLFVDNESNVEFLFSLSAAVVLYTSSVQEDAVPM